MASGSSKFSCCSEVPFEYVVRFMAKMAEVSYKKKEAHIKLFLDKCVPRNTPDIFAIFRLLLPLVSWWLQGAGSANSRRQERAGGR
jgi:hypothetical protein